MNRRSKIVLAIITFVSFGLSDVAKSATVSLTCEVDTAQFFTQNQIYFSEDFAGTTVTLVFTTQKPYTVSVENVAVLNQKVFDFTEKENEYQILSIECRCIKPKSF